MNDETVETRVTEELSELPETGPAEVVLAVIIVLSLAAGGVYWYWTHRVVKRVTKRAKGHR